ncbi:NUDIX hydrolase [Rossellomorea aquimaris]|uniref:NUDIX hydrolase n=1 Tax=Rossellomorea aquimaris TaxID=189382 RepID=UPI001CD496C6|nr:NUDIX hydrolase [Rossellomorea aquimaris]MCA1054436.1 NUDIX hydrolase [Rossellomorea aquimaris]
MGYIQELRELVGTRPVILPGAVVIILDGKGNVLLQQRRFPNGKWGLPGGLMELAESTEETARREVWEETRLELGELHLMNVYSGSDQYIKAENGDEFYVVATVYFTDEYHGEMKADQTESYMLMFHPLEELPENMVGSHREMVEEYRRKFVEVAST